MSGAELGIIVGVSLVIVVTLHRVLLRIDRRLGYRAELDELNRSADEPIDLVHLVDAMRKNCRFCNKPVDGPAVISTDGQRSHGECYQAWAERTARELRK